MKSRRSTLVGLAAGLAVICAGPSPGLAKGPVEVVYATFLDPGSRYDPSAAAQTKMIEAFENANPDIKVRVQVDSNQQASLRALRSKTATSDVFRVNNFSYPKFVATGSVLPLDELIARDKVDMKDWLLPLDAARFEGKLSGMQQDFRLPILL